MELITMTLCERCKLAYEKKNITYTKLSYKKIKSHTCLGIFQSTNRTTLTEEDIASSSFRKPKNAEEERKLIENGTPKVSYSTEKEFFEILFFWNAEW